MLERFIDQIGNIRLGRLDLPVGKGFLFAFFDGVMTALSASVKGVIPGNLPAVATDAALALAVKKIGPVRKFLGENGAELAAFVSMTNAFDHAPELVLKGPDRYVPLSQLIEHKLRAIMPFSGPGLAGPALSDSGLSAPEVAASEVSAPVAGEELLNSVERKLRAIKQAEA